MIIRTAQLRFLENFGMEMVELAKRKAQKPAKKALKSACSCVAETRPSSSVVSSQHVQRRRVRLCFCTERPVLSPAVPPPVRPVAAAEAADKLEYILRSTVPGARAATRVHRLHSGQHARR